MLDVVHDAHYNAGFPPSCGADAQPIDTRRKEPIVAATYKPTLVLGGTGKTGRRVVERLTARGLPARVGSRSGEPAFDWEDRSTWAPALNGMGAVYLTYYPDLSGPGAAEATHAFAELAVHSGVSRLVLLSGRGEPQAERAEQAVRDTGAELTVLRATWFMQNFDEDYMREHVLSGEIRLPAGDVPTPFVDAEDIADIAVAALTDDRHVGKLYELTGPRSLTMAEAAAEIAAAAGRDVRYVPISIAQHESEAREHGVPPDVVEILTYLFVEVATAATPTPRTTCSARSAARRATSPTTRAPPRRPACGTGDRIWPPEDEERERWPTKDRRWRTPRAASGSRSGGRRRRRTGSSWRSSSSCLRGGAFPVRCTSTRSRRSASRSSTEPCASGSAGSR
jgi:uncharacterized protein YbjT (DUF2867 family)